ncbi:MAG: putative pyridoxal-dependent aspartate 1-decarboxylase [Candidatus Angelobacter sp. Gp1-AA117]|nr:MAG: putative pyridoxal-dependent aspartate 1-decarboxylase [Candidatus Angelobacter sp. Gp1-AA117]
MLSSGSCSFQDHILGLFSNSAEAEANYAAARQRLLAALANWRNQTANSLSPDPDSSSPTNLLDYFEQLERTVIRNSADLASPLCMGHMSGIYPRFMALIGELILSLNQNLVKREASPVLTQVELETLAALHRLIYNQTSGFYLRHVQDHASTLGLVTSGGTLGNLTALWIARNLSFMPRHDFPGIEAAGMTRALEHYGYESAVIVGSRLMHYSMEKAAALLGLGTQNVLLLPVDRDNRLETSALQDCISDCATHRKRIIAVLGIAGTTECGSIDPLQTIAEIARAGNIFFHVDAAWGGPLLFSQQHRRLLSGIEQADSVVLDGHKQMYLPVAASALLLRDPTAARAIEKHSHYMLQEGSGDLGRRSLEGSRNGAALFFHAALRLIGEQGYGFLMEENLRKSRIMAELVRMRPEFELLSESQTNILLYRGLPLALRGRRMSPFSSEEHAVINAFNERLQKQQSQAGRTFVSRTTIALGNASPAAPLVALRAVITNPLLQQHHMQSVLEDQVSIMAELENQADRETSGCFAVHPVR